MTRDQYIKKLSKGPCTVLFTKNDGSLRKIYCTLKEDLIAEDRKPTNKERKVNTDSVPVWDLEKLEWRSFRVDSVEDFI